MSRKVGMFIESIRVMRALWKGEPVSESKYWDIHEARISPVPTEQVDIWVGATVDAAIERTAEIAEAWLANPGLTSNEAGEAISRYQQYCENHSRHPTAIAIRKDIYVGETSEQAHAAVQPYIEHGYRGIAPEALMVGSAEEVANQMSTLEGQGYTDVIVRNISTNQDECLECIHRLSDVKALLEERG